jgi:membrane-associated phospholipid phosphatase
MVMIGALHLYANVCINIKISPYFMEMLSNLFNEIGSLGPIILNFLSMYLLWNKNNLFFYYIVGAFIDAILNLILKGLFQQPRPTIDQKSFDLALKYGKRFLFKDGMPYDMFGMPSGHSQSVFFSTVFIYLSLKKNNITYIYLAISLLTMLQRVVYNHHTVLQVIVGGLIGSAVGYLFYYLSSEKVKGLIREKLDDFGPI